MPNSVWGLHLPKGEENVRVTERVSLKKKVQIRMGIKENMQIKGEDRSQPKRGTCGFGSILATPWRGVGACAWEAHISEGTSHPIPTAKASNLDQVPITSKLGIEQTQAFMLERKREKISKEQV